LPAHQHLRMAGGRRSLSVDGPEVLVDLAALSRPLSRVERFMRGTAGRPRRARFCNRLRKTRNHGKAGACLQEGKAWMRSATNSPRFYRYSRVWTRRLRRTAGVMVTFVIDDHALIGSKNVILSFCIISSTMGPKILRAAAGAGTIRAHLPEQKHSPAPGLGVGRW